MKAHDYSFAGAYTNTYWSTPNDPRIIDQGLSPRRRDVFNFSGFGPSDFKLASPGSFEKRVTDHMYGVSDTTEAYSNGALPTRQKLEGVLTTYGLYVEPVIASIGDPRGKCIDKIYDKIRGDNAGLGETAGEQAGGLRDLSTAYRNVKRESDSFSDNVGHLLKKLASDNKRAFKNKARYIGSKTLAWNFGLAPTAQSLSDAIDILQREIEVRVHTVHARHACKGVNSQSQYVMRGQNKSTTTQVDRCEMGVRYIISNPTLFKASLLGLTNPALTLWQLTKLSFVVDWVWNVGNYLDRLENALGLGLTFVDGYETLSSKSDTVTEWVLNTTYSAGGGRYATGLGIARGREVKKTKHRVRLQTFPGPAIPAITNPFKLGSPRLINQAALLTQFL